MADYNYLLTDLQAPGRELHAVNGHIVRREIIWYAWGRIHGKFGYLEERAIAPLLVSESLARDNLHDGENIYRRNEKIVGWRLLTLGNFPPLVEGAEIFYIGTHENHFSGVKD